MYNTKINVCSLCIGFLLTLDKDLNCNCCLDQKDFICPLKDDILYQKSISEFDSFIDAQIKKVIPLINNHVILPEETITLQYDISCKTSNNSKSIKS